MLLRPKVEGASARANRARLGIAWDGGTSSGERWLQGRRESLLAPGTGAVAAYLVGKVADADRLLEVAGEPSGE
jgi:hypothetical protein